MPCNARKRVHCWGSAASESVAAAPRKKPTVKDADGEESRSRCLESTSEDTEAGMVSGSNVLSSNEESSFTQGSGSDCGSSETGFLSTGVNGCNLEEICETRVGSEGLETETSEKPEECEDSTPFTPEMRPKPLKNVDPTSLVSNVRNLLSTGILEGLPIKYKFKSHKVQLPGFIKGVGYLCGCSSCNYTKVLSALEFEKHSGTTSKNQNNHIFLDNEKSLYNVVKQLAKYPLNALENVIEGVIGCPPNWKCYKAWKELFPVESQEVGDTYLKTRLKKFSQPEIHNEDQAVASIPECTQESHISSDGKSEMQQTPVVICGTPKTSNHGRSQECDTSSSLNYVTRGAPCKVKQFSGSPAYLQNISFEGRNISSHTSKGRRHATNMSKSPGHHCMPGVAMHPHMQPNGSTQTCANKRDSNLHHLIFMENGLPDGAELAYCVRGQKVLKGNKLGSAIVCNCCHTKISPSQFEAHAGWARRRQPYRHIFTSNGVSLHDLSISLSKGQHLTTIRSEDECSICGDGGELILCAQCPKAFHIVCLGLHHMPDGEWSCTYCEDETTPGMASADAQMAVRVGRVIVAPTLETGCCSMCRGSNFSCSDSFNDETVLICDQCEKEYHVGCLRSSGLCDLQVLPRGNWFCCSNCMSMHASLRNIATSGANIVHEVLSDHLKMKLRKKCLMDESGLDVRWQLLSGNIRSSENKFLLSKAFKIFRNGFDPITERSGRDLIPAMVYGRNMGGHELGGMYCAILTVKSVVVSAAILRVFGHEVAEIPLVATTQESQGKGYFGCLFSCIEMLLGNLNVETWILPATENAESMWIQKFGFKRMAAERFQKFAEVFPIMKFRGTKMLEKPVLPATMVEQTLQNMQLSSLSCNV